MKITKSTVKVELEMTGEMYLALMELSKEMNSQDHRSTRMPYFFQVQHLKEVACYEGQGTEIWANQDENELRTEEEINEEVGNIIDADFMAYFKDVERWKVNPETNDEYKQTYIGEHIADMDHSDKEELLEANEYQKYNVEDVKVYSKCFFTAKACKQHIENNKHHYREPVSYLMGNSRSPEIELIQQFLCELSGGKLHK